MADMVASGADIYGLAIQPFSGSVTVAREGSPGKAIIAPSGVQTYPRFEPLAFDDDPRFDDPDYCHPVEPLPHWRNDCGEDGL